MHREQFGAWGAHLENTPFWQAVAALGCTEALAPGTALRPDGAAPRPFPDSLFMPASLCQPLRWAWSLTDLADWGEALARGPVPEEWLQLWTELREAAQGYLPRLALATLFDNQSELTGWFLQGVASAVYTERPVETPGLHWQRAVRVGGPNQTSDESDLLVLTAPLAEAAAELRRSPAVLRANCVIVPQTRPVDWRQGLEQAEELMQLCAANAVLLAPFSGHPAEYAAGVRQNLLAGQPLDEAAQVPACLEPGAVATLLASSALIEATAPPVRASSIRGAPPIPVSFSYLMADEEPPKRYLLADLYEQANPTQPIRTLPPAADLSIAVSIAPPRDGAIVASDLFPDQECAGQLLTLLFVEPRLAPEPQLRTLYLPTSGASAEVRFALRLAADTAAIEARISVLYRNRILQTALLRGAVGERPRLDVEMSVRPGMRNLDQQRPADYSLLLNHSGDGEARATAGAGYAFASFSMQGLETSIDAIEVQVNATAWDDADFANLEAEGTQTLLRYLARHGSALYREFLRYEHDDQRLQNSRFVQVVSREHGARLPIEFFYDRKTPKAEATLCPQAREALQNGTCATCPGDDAQRICPLGFWCFRKVIEWHRFRDDAKDTTEGRAYALRDVAPGERPAALPPFDSALLAASVKVDSVVAGSVESVRCQLTAKFGANVALVESWQAWRQAVAARSPALLLLLPHTAKDDDDVPQLEIHGDLLASLDIEPADVVGPAGTPHPVVVLLGCNTDNSGLPFESFVPSFEDNQAAIIVTSISKVLGRFAAPLARTFIDRLAALPRDGQSSIGEAMLQLRRQAMLDGPPLALVLKSYGDADWRV